MRILAVASAALLSLFAQVAAAQQTYTSLAGPWWLTLGGKDKGAVLIEFTAPKAGVFNVKDIELTGNPSFGYSRSLGAFFQIPEDEELAFDANGAIAGSLQLVEPETGALLATLSIEKGKADKTFTSLKLRGTIECASPGCTASSPVAVKLKGGRPPNAFPVLSGRTSQGTIKGKGVKSKALDLSVKTDGVLGLPAYAWTAEGPAEIDKEPADVALSGRIMLSPSFKAQGLVDESDPFDPGLANGKLRLADPNSLIPKFGVVVASAPKLKVKGQLIEPAEPVLQVTPNGTVDFGAVRLDASSTKTFAVSNVGTDTLSGEASFVAGSSLDFELGAVTSYTDLVKDGPAEEIEVTFTPSSAGAKTASLRFGVEGGAGAQVVQLTASGGVAEITVDPGSVSFPNTTLNTTAEETVTLTNTGDIALTGQASLGTSLVFSLVGPTDYTLAPGGEQVFTLQFKPTAAITSSTTLTFTGGSAGSKSVSVTGTGTSP